MTVVPSDFLSWRRMILPLAGRAVHQKFMQVIFHKRIVIASVLTDNFLFMCAPRWPLEFLTDLLDLQHRVSEVLSASTCSMIGHDSAEKYNPYSRAEAKGFDKTRRNVSKYLFQTKQTFTMRVTNLPASHHPPRSHAGFSELAQHKSYFLLRMMKLQIENPKSWVECLERCAGDGFGVNKLST